MYLKKTTAKLADGTKVKYLHLAQNYWDSEAQCSKTNIIYSFGREDKLDKEKLKGYSDELLIEARICPICLKEDDKVTKLEKGGGCVDCPECGFSVCG